MTSMPDRNNSRSAITLSCGKSNSAPSDNHPAWVSTLFSSSSSSSSSSFFFLFLPSSSSFRFFVLSNLFVLSFFYLFIFFPSNPYAPGIPLDAKTPRLDPTVWIDVNRPKKKQQNLKKKRKFRPFRRRRT